MLDDSGVMAESEVAQDGKSRQVRLEAHRPQEGTRMMAAKSSKGKKPKVRTPEYRKQLRDDLKPLLETGWLEEKAKALRKRVGLPEEGLQISFEKGEYWSEELSDWWAATAGRAQKEYLGRPPEENPLHIFSEGIERIMEGSRLKDPVWREFFAGYVVGYLKTIDDMPLPGRASIATGPFGPKGEIETVIRLRGIPTVREMHRLLRTLRNLDAIWRTDWVPPQQREDARIYERIEAPWTWLDDPEKWPDKFTKEDAKRAIAVERLHDRYAPFVDPRTGLPEELEREYHLVCNAYEREQKRRKAQRD